jgi:hypothetical protein
MGRNDMPFVLALYEGNTVGGLHLIDVSTDEYLVRLFADHRLRKIDSHATLVSEMVEEGRREALRTVVDETEGGEKETK